MATDETQPKSHGDATQADDPAHHATQTRNTAGVYAPRVDFVETSEAFQMYALMPGVRPEDVSLHCKEGQLVLHGRCLPRLQRKRPLHQEYGVGDFYRTFALPETVDPTNISANLEDGVLCILLNKKESARPRRIAVTGK